MSASVIRVWDPLVRLFHWSLVTGFLIAYLSGEEESLVHTYSGYAVIALLLTRALWGFIGTKYARFSQFVYAPASVIRYLRGLVAGRPEHYTGHNPAAAWMIFALLLCLALTSFTGLKVYGIEGHGPLASSADASPIMATGFGLVRNSHARDDLEDAYEEYYQSLKEEREEMWEEIHEFFANLSLFLIFVHIAGAIGASLVHKENLIKAMITGTKRRRTD